MSKHPINHLTSLADHITTQYGERGTPAREEFEKGFAAFKRAALRQQPITKFLRRPIPMAKYRASPNESEVLPNLLGLTEATAIGLAEFEGFLRADILLSEALNSTTTFSLSYLLEMHRLALGHLYAFAGRCREVNISKGGFAFPAARFLPASMQQFEQDWLSLPLPTDRDALLNQVSAIHGELLFIHPFREGNGRTARLLANLMLEQQGHERLRWELIDEAAFPRYVAAVQQSGLGNYGPMQALMRALSPS